MPDNGKIWVGMGLMCQENEHCRLQLAVPHKSAAGFLKPDFS